MSIDEDNFKIKNVMAKELPAQYFLKMSQRPISFVKLGRKANRNG